MRTFPGALLVTIALAAHSSEPAAVLQEYAANVAASSESGALEVGSIKQTMSDPFIAYVVVFRTSHKSLLAAPDGDTDPKAYALNSSRTKAWEAKFCTAKLKALMDRIGATMVTGDLQSKAGETQSLASCMR